MAPSSGHRPKSQTTDRTHGHSDSFIKLCGVGGYAGCVLFFAFAGIDLIPLCGPPSASFRCRSGRKSARPRIGGASRRSSIRRLAAATARRVVRSEPVLPIGSCAAHSEPTERSLAEVADATHRLPLGRSRDRLWAGLYVALSVVDTSVVIAAFASWHAQHPVADRCRRL
jgi:hypothetical protein